MRLGGIGRVRSLAAQIRDGVIDLSRGGEQPGTTDSGSQVLGLCLQHLLIEGRCLLDLAATEIEIEHFAL